MDFQDFIIDIMQDYGAIIYPLGIMGVLYLFSRLKSKQSSAQFGLAQGVASGGKGDTARGDEKVQVRKREAANGHMDELAQSEEFGGEEFEDLDEEERRFGIIEEDDDVESEEEVVEDDFDEEEAYGDYIDNAPLNKEGGSSVGSGEGQANQGVEAESQLKHGQGHTEERLGALIVMYLVPKVGKQFLGYELLQALSNYHVHLSEKKHFQRFEHDSGKGDLWYHVASMTHPGTFDMREPGKLICKGLVFIMETEKVSDLSAAYNSMLETCQLLADDLGADLLDENQLPLNENKVRKTKYYIAKSQISESVD